MDFELIVVGKGLWGSAAGRYLSDWGHQVAVIGPDEPADQTTHEGVFASHYDQGRLTGQLGRGGVYDTAAEQAIANYHLLEERSGIPFYEPVGVLWAERVTDEESDLAQLHASAVARGLAHQFFAVDDQSWRAQFPYLDYPEGFSILFEAGPAGHINPRKLVQAQLAIAQQQGVTVIPETVCGVTADGSGVTVQTQEGQTYRGEKVLIAAGAFTNFSGLLPQPIPLKAKTETIILGRVSEEAAAELSGMPTVVYQVEDPEIDDIYMTPSIRYPDGRFYVKMGCNTAADQWPETLEAVQNWFHEGDSDAHLAAMRRAMQGQLPQVEFEHVESKRCIVCYTPNRVPTIDHVDERVVVAAGGNGSGAKGSDSWGRLAAGLLADGRWPDEFPREPFSAGAGADH